MNVLLSVLGGLLSLDQSSVGQFMIARPLVSGTLTGALLGDPGSGLLAGSFLEILFLPAFPVGGARFPEGAPAGIVAAAAATAEPGGVGLATGVALGSLWGLLGGWSVTGLRRLNERLAASPEKGDLPPSRVVAGHLAALALDFVRGTAVTALGLGAVALAAPGLNGLWPLEGRGTLLALGTAAAVSAGGLVASFGGWRRRRGAILSGVLLGVVAGWLA